MKSYLSDLTYNQRLRKIGLGVGPKLAAEIRATFESWGERWRVYNAENEARILRILSPWPPRWWED